MSPSKHLGLSGRSILDGLLVIGLLALCWTFGCFRQVDADIWWHLRTGKLILERGEVPRKDWLTFTASDRDWIDLHWVFQVTAAKLYEWGGMPLLTLCSATLGTLAVAVALAARRSGWSAPLAVACWLPAIFLLSGRLYVRPEMVTLLFLSVFLTVLFHAEQFPKLLWVLVPVQLVWVNVQGLFVFGPVLLAFWWIDVGLRRWQGQGRPVPWHAVLVTTCVFAACLANPYRWRGAIFPWELFQKMSAEHQFYGRHIGELRSIPGFIADYGVRNVYLILHLGLLAAGAVSFTLPLISRRVPWFRLLLFVAFGWLGLQATRNSGQFALVAGSTLAWNIGEWWAARRHNSGSVWRLQTGRAMLAAALAGSLVFVASGSFYARAGEGRLVGLQEQPLWHAHDAARFAAGPDMPRHVLAYHEGLAAVFEFHMRSDQRVYCDPRLEVMPRQLMEQYYDLGEAIAANRFDWRGRIARLPSDLTVLADHRGHFALEATLLSDPNWSCVYFDPVAAVYLPKGLADRLRLRAVDFAARHFDSGGVVSTLPKFEWTTGPSQSQRKPAAGQAVAPTPQSEFVEADALFNIVRSLQERPAGNTSLIRSLALLMLHDAHAGLSRFPGSHEGWRSIGMGLLFLADPPAPGDAVTGTDELDWDAPTMLDLARARYVLSRARAIQPDDFATLVALFAVAGAQRDLIHQLDYAKRLQARGARTIRERQTLEGIHKGVDTLTRRYEAMADESFYQVPLGPQELQREIKRLVASGRMAATVSLFGHFIHSGGELPWMLADRFAGVLMHTGEPEAARRVWQNKAADEFDEAQRVERIASTYWVEGDYVAAIAQYRVALRISSECVAARWGLARLYLEMGDAGKVVGECDAGLLIPGISGRVRSSLEWMREFALPFATPKLEDPSSHAAH